jgi:hypothetical protein
MYRQTPFLCLKSIHTHSNGISKPEGGLSQVVLKWNDGVCSCCPKNHIIYQSQLYLSWPFSRRTMHMYMFPTLNAQEHLEVQIPALADIVCLLMGSTTVYTHDVPTQYAGQKGQCISQNSTSTDQVCGATSLERFTRSSRDRTMRASLSF